MNFVKKSYQNKKMQYGGMLIELLLSIALMTLILPFVFNYQRDAVRRAENISITNQMAVVQSAMEKYISENRENLLISVGRNIKRVNLSDLEQYGLGTDFIESNKDKYQLRVLKSTDKNNQSTLQGVVVFTSDKITPIRTREIVSVGGYNMGFVDGNKAYGPFGVWHADAIDMGIDASDGIVGTTSINRDNSLYLWRVPSDNTSDSTMMTSLNLGGHDIINAKFMDLYSGTFDEFINGLKMVCHNLIFENRTSIENEFKTKSATVSGNLSADSRNMEVSGRFYLSDTGKFSDFNTNELWVSNLKLSGFSISNDLTEPAVLQINQSLDMTYGRISALYTTVGFSGSITPSLTVHSRIQDSTNENYYWDIESGTASFGDVSLPVLNQMAQDVIRIEHDDKIQTVSARKFSSVANNSNATVGDFINTINEIESNVRSKYRMLNLE